MNHNHNGRDGSDYQKSMMVLESLNARRLAMARAEAEGGNIFIPHPPSPCRSFGSTEDGDGFVEDELVITNGAKSGANDDDTEVAENGDGKDTEESNVKYEPGMKTGMKNLYSGKEDRRGRYQWLEKMPKDLGGPAENKKTAKWALLVRNVKVYNDPTKVLAIHSIVVQSPLLKTLLAGVLKGYPGITVGLNRLEFSGKFEPLIHRWSELQAAISKLGAETETDRTTKEHAELLQKILVDEFKTLIDTSQDMKNKREFTPFQRLQLLLKSVFVVCADFFSAN